VHLRISSPPTVGPCHYGIDTPDRDKLIASAHSAEEICRFVGADSLGYLSLTGLRDSINCAGGTDEHRGLCDGCFSNVYPIAASPPARCRQLRLITA
jgi:amidophosphoribosyltransferase